MNREKKGIQFTRTYSHQGTIQRYLNNIQTVSATIDACYTSNISSFQFIGFMRVLWFVNLRKWEEKDNELMKVNCISILLKFVQRMSLYTKLMLCYLKHK